ncbi:hypothetical protein [Hominenteromicrobium sp.]|uniref:hypothetical protein n=1 Tax=Hominenteromicrobium sp. TaxID=3073581 RepID=UPI0039965A9D
MARKNPPFSRRPGKEKAGNRIKDFLLGGAAGGRLVFSCKSSGQRGPKGDCSINWDFLLSGAANERLIFNCFASHNLLKAL